MIDPTIQIRAPKFELYELVTLHWNNQERSTKIVRRWLDIDDGGEGYWYKVAGDDQQFYPEGALEPRRE